MIEIFAGKRQTGKTTAAITWLKENIEAGNNPVLVTTTQDRAHDLASTYNIDLKYIVTLGRARVGGLAGQWGPVALDTEVRLEGLLQAYLSTHRPVEWVALTDISSATVRL